jgi:aminocarboxymuconate-semialdehyde decarboxylase
VHAHTIPKEFLDAVDRDRRFRARVEREGSTVWLVHSEGYRYPVTPDFYDVQARLAALDRMGVDGAVLSPSPTLFYYDADPQFAAEVAHLINGAQAAIVRGSPGRLKALGVVPLQDPQAAVRELERCMRELGFAGAHVGCTVGRENVFVAAREPFFARAAELGALIFVHPSYVGLRPGLEQYYLTNLVGNPLETTVSICHAIFSGLVERYPELRLLFAHGGGFAPYQLGRFDHGSVVRAEARGMSQKPSCYARKLFYDSITHSGPALAYLAEIVGAEQVLLGSDAPFDMADPDPVGTVERCGLDEDARRKVLGDNARALINWSELKPEVRDG